jgi:hypothetical protein
MRKATIVLLFIFGISGLGIAILWMAEVSRAETMLFERHSTEAKRLAEKKANDVVAELFHKGLEGYTVCNGDSKIEMENRVYWQTCTVTANFYDPQGKPIIKGKSRIFPIGIFTNLEEGRRYIRQGFVASNISINVTIWKNDPGYSPTMATYQLPLTSLPSS